MNITVVCDVLGLPNNGTSMAAFNLINSMRDRGHRVKVVCPDVDKSGREDYFITPRYNFGVFNKYVAKNGVSLGKADEDILRVAMADADVVHILLPFSLGISAQKLAIEKGLPVTASFHCQAENITSHIHLKDSKKANLVTYKILRHRFFDRCDCIHYPSKFICDTFESCTGPTNHYIISNGVSGDFRRCPAEKPDELKGKFVILFTGRYSREKRHDVLTDAIALSKHRDEIVPIYAGCGPLESEIREHAIHKIGREPVMKFFSRDEMVKVINYSDLYVHPAEIEIEAIACLEAISCGRIPVISNSPRSATRNFALGENNLFRCNDPQDLADKIDFWIENPDERKVCEENYLGYATQFSFESCMVKMEQMLLDAIELKKKK